MTTWIGLLRAVNLGGRRTFSPPQIVACVEAVGGSDVQTHINTGNVRFTTRMRSRERITDALEGAFAADRGFEVPVALLTPAELREIADDVEELGAGHGGRHYVSVLRGAASPAAVAALEARSTAGERAVVRGRAVHLLLGENYHEAKLTNAVVERLAGTATNRNATVIRAMAAKWGSPPRGDSPH